MRATSRNLPKKSPALSGSRERADSGGTAKQPTTTRHTRPESTTDVLLGRGRGCTDSEGNRRYLAIIEQFGPFYLDAKNRKEQHRIKLCIIEEVRNYGGRFLQPAEGSAERDWHEAPLKIVLDKIAQSLRHYIRKHKLRSDQTNGKSGTQASTSTVFEDVEPVNAWPTTTPPDYQQQHAAPPLNRDQTLDSAALRGAFQPPAYSSRPAQKFANDDVKIFGDSFWRNVAFFQGAQDDHNFSLQPNRRGEV